MKDQYAVFGNPIAHSKSPRIHTLFAEQTGENIEYTKKLVELGQFANEAKKFFDTGGKGLNVTVPFKLDAFEFAKTFGDNSLSGEAFCAGAVNTLKKYDDGKIIGYNTDGVGLIRDLGNKLSSSIGPSAANLVGRSALILGAGGAVRGILSEILRAGVSEVTIVNRTEATAVELAENFNQIQSKIKIRGCGYKTLDKNPVAIIINGTSASLSGDLPPLPDQIVSSTTLCYDMMYGNKDTVFMQWAKKHGSQCVFDGLGMLVEQAAESFFIWRGVRPETQTVIEKVRSEL